ncbi:MAG: Fe-S cluster assembly protein SufD [Lactobacillus sp.]
MKSAIVTYSQAQHEPSFMLQLRQRASEILETAKLPYIQRFRYHNWDLVDQQLKLAISNQAALPAALQQPAPAEAVQFVALGQTTVRCQLPVTLAAQGVRLMDLPTALRKQPELMQQHLMQVIKADEDQLTAYHAAYLTSGVVLYVPAGVKVTEPVELELVQDASQKLPFVSHVLAVAERAASVKVVEHLATIGSVPNTANLMVEVAAAAGSQVEFSSLDELGAQTTLAFNRRADIGRDAHVEWNVALMNDGNTIGDLASELVGEGSYADSKVIAVTARDEQVAINNRVINRGRHSTGLINQRGVLLDQSKLIFNGIGQIVHGASGAKADQKNRVLMMSDEAHGDANPLLLIDENDVIAAHAASVGPVDPIQMNYLMSRGLTYPTAERMVIHGFLDAVLSGMPAGLVRDRMLAILERKLIHGQKQRFATV